MHFKSIIYGSSIISTIYQLKLIFRSKIGKYNFKNLASSIITRIYLLFNLHVFTVVSYSIAIIDGNNFKESTKKAFDLMMNNRFKSITLTYVS